MNLTRFGGREIVQEYAAALNDEELHKLLPKNLCPTNLSAITKPGTIKIKGLPPTRKSPRIAAMAT